LYLFILIKAVTYRLNPNKSYDRNRRTSHFLLLSDETNFSLTEKMSSWLLSFWYDLRSGFAGSVINFRVYMTPHHISHFRRNKIQLILFESFTWHSFQTSGTVTFAKHPFPDKLNECIQYLYGSPGYYASLPKR
jgi:hypothetical protein